MPLLIGSRRLERGRSTPNRSRSVNVFRPVSSRLNTRFSPRAGTREKTHPSAPRRDAARRRRVRYCGRDASSARLGYPPARAIRQERLEEARDRRLRI
eukprot:31206-Pelagococcus_subviridis.AAC.5